MKTMKALFVFLLLCVPSHRLRAESWPTHEQYVDSCVLIVLCRAEVKDNKVSYRILETWKGVYSPDLFYHKPPDGYLFTGTWHGNDSPKDGRESVFFFTAHNHPLWTKGLLLDHSTNFVISNGKLTYASTGNPGESRDYTVTEFRSAIQQLVRAEYAKKVKDQVNKAQGH